MISMPHSGLFSRPFLMLVAMLVPFANADAALAQIELQCLTLPLPAECESFVFDLDVSGVTDTFGIFGALQAGDILSGTFTTFNDFPDVDPDPDNGRYLNSVECVRLDLGDRELVVVLAPQEIVIPPSASDPGVIVMNDTPSLVGPFTLFSDSASFLMAGPGAMLQDATPMQLSFVGAGGFSFGYADACISGIDTPCPRTLLTNDGFPSAPGDTTVIDTAQMTFDYLSFTGFPATANGDLLAIDPAPPIPCPEPGFSGAMMSGVFALGLLGRNKRRS